MHMTQQQLADEVGVSRRTVTSWERGESTPQNRTAAVAEVLRIGDLRDLPEFGSDALLRRLGQLAKQRREEIGVGRPAFAKEAGLGSDRTVVQFEFGRVLPSGTSQRRIEKALGWRLGAIEDAMAMLDRKASDIRMEELDAEDSLYVAGQHTTALSLVSSEDLLAELARRLGVGSGLKADVQDLYGLAASTNSEHLEDENGEPAE